ncbi:probable xanthan lyase [Blastopirellula marina DSM 3645]|uniref:Probable xanthan lyase n=1 Tax=Blastopirellula marina DSM 3645 TaxID=314230 RepID=A3ZRP6_9BACT|nr:probable xanthan lyase [Blastopirellula marina DSM 3645]
MGIYGQLPAQTNKTDAQFDVVIYGGTSAGIMAAVQAKRLGKSVVVLEPSTRIGGLTTGGLGATDIGNKAAIGGLAREFYVAVRDYYSDADHWKFQTAPSFANKRFDDLKVSRQEAMWGFEPSAALQIMQAFVDRQQIPVVYQAKLDRTPITAGKPEVQGVMTSGHKIVAIKLLHGDIYRGKVFIDATYEGDLMAGAGVSYATGREANAAYGETLNGVQTRQAHFHIFQPKVDPYIVPGRPDSGLLPGIDPHGPGDEGSADRRIQAYCFRMCLTDHPNNRIPFAKPDDYNPALYELLLRNYEAGERGLPWINSGMPNRKTDTNNRLGFSTDFIGQNYDYPEASDSERELIIDRHRSYQQGLMWTLAYHPRMPEEIRAEVSRWGMCRDEFQAGNGWQEQLYVREARRMIGDYVMTQHHCVGETVADKSIGLAAYGMDSHHVQRYVTAEGYVQNEGDVEVGVKSPYSIDYGAITPRAAECENLLVPVCVSSSHIAYGSIRMEPVFMVLGQSAAVAAAMSIDMNIPVQQVPYEELSAQLKQGQQVLQWDAVK